MGRYTSQNKFVIACKKWSGKAVPFAIVAVLAFGLGMKLSNVDFSSLKHTKDSKAPTDLSYTSVEELYDRLRAKYDGQLDGDKLVDGMKKGLVEATGDPYTVYLTAKESDEFMNELEGRFSGIGAELGKRENQLVIIAPLDGFPAQKAGLRPGDAIIEVNGEAASKWSVEQAVGKIRGEKGTKVTLKVARDSKPLDFTITREDITVPSVKHEITVDGIGYMQITRFADDTADLARKAAEEFKAKNVKGVVVDVRANGGGYLQSAVDVASLWLDKGQTVVEEREGTKVIEKLEANGNNILGSTPTVVLIDGGSASASEILAGALNDHGKATLVGEKSFGKGSVQELQKLNDGGELKVTIARWYTPNGKNIDKEGVTPKEQVELTEEDFKAERDPQKDKAYSILK